MLTTIQQDREVSRPERCNQRLAFHHRRPRIYVARIDTSFAERVRQVSHMREVHAEDECRLPVTCTTEQSATLPTDPDDQHTPARSIQLCKINLFTVGVLTTCARLVALKSPDAELTVTPVRSMFARTDVNRTLHNLCEPARQTGAGGYHLFGENFEGSHAPLILDHLQEILVIHDALEHRPQCETVMATEGRREPDDGDVVGDGGELC